MACALDTVTDTNHPTTTALPPQGVTILIALLTMMGPFAIDTYLPSFPAIESAFGVTTAAVAQTLSLYLFAFASMALFYGPLSDSVGRRPVMIGALLLFAGASVGCAMAEDFTVLLVFRAIQGIAGAGSMVVGRAVIRDVFAGPDAQKAMSRVMLMFALAPALAPIIGGHLQEWFGWRSVFVFLGLYALAMIVMILWLLPETLPKEHRQPVHAGKMIGSYGKALSHPRFLALVLAFTFAFAGMFLYIAGSPMVVITHLGMAADDFAYQFVPMVAGVMLGSLASGQLAHRWPATRTVQTALAIMFAASLINLLQAAFLPVAAFNVIAPLPLYSFGVALAMPNVTVMALDCFPRNKGMASSMQGFIQMVFNGIVAGAFVPLVAPAIFNFAVGMGLLVGAAFLMWWLASHMGRRLDPS